MAFRAGAALEYLRDEIAIVIIAVGIDGRNGANTTCCGPCPRTCMICDSYTFATLNQRPYFATAVDDGLQTLEHVILTPNQNAPSGAPSP